MGTHYGISILFLSRIDFYIHDRAIGASWVFLKKDTCRFITIHSCGSMYKVLKADRMCHGQEHYILQKQHNDFDDSSS